MQTIKGRSAFIAGLSAIALAAIGAIGSAGATSANVDVSDIWWNPAEQGWGVQLVDTGTFVFATVFTYGTDGKPTWVTGELSKTDAIAVTFTGPTYANTGTYFGGTWNPQAAASRQVGTMTFSLNRSSAGQLSYTVDGVPVSRYVERQSLTADNYSGNYLAAMTQTIVTCDNPASDGITAEAGSVFVTQDGPSIIVVTTDARGSTCTIYGTYSQLGRMGRVDGPYTCQSGEDGAAILYGMTNAPSMFMASLQLTSVNSGCSRTGRIVAVLPN
jgi:hypothetical protein